jgi:ABC-type polysaccharide/polyol phosphate export permease
MAWFFLTPVVYDISMIAPIVAKYPVLGQLYFLNPMAGILSLYRTALLGSPLPAISSLLLSVAVAAVVCAGGIMLFQKLQPGFSDEL